MAVSELSVLAIINNTVPLLMGVRRQSGNVANVEMPACLPGKVVATPVVTLAVLAPALSSTSEGLGPVY